jgi:two-component system sensor histidine kinase PilS (NtrC family)
MAHEVRNPLAAISGSIQMLRGSLAADEKDAEGRRLMDIVLRETDRLDGLIAEFLRFARPAPAQRTVVDLAALVRDLLEVFGGSCPAGIDVASEVAPGTAVLADADQIRQLLWNLLLNAVQAMPTGGQLRVGAERFEETAQGARDMGRNASEGGEGARVEITVADSGTGIVPEVLERIFEPFFTTRAAGSGLGLATVHRLAEANGGGLRVETTPGEGTVFRVLLQAAEVVS